MNRSYQPHSRQYSPQPTGLYSNDLDLIIGNLCPVDGVIAITFSEDVYLTENTTVSITGSDESGDVQTTATCTLTVEGNTLYLTPDERLFSSLTYSIKAGGLVQDVEGNVYESDDVTYTFTTESKVLTVVDQTPTSHDYPHALKFTFSSAIKIADKSGIYLQSIDPELGTPSIIPISNYAIYDNTLYLFHSGKLHRKICLHHRCNRKPI